MIKVNLLPDRRRSKRQPIRPLTGQRGLLIGAALITLISLGLGSMVLHQEYKGLLSEKKAKMATLAELKKESQEIEQLEGTYQTLLTRVRLLEHQSGRKFVPVRLMDSISQKLTPLSLWLLSLGFDGKKVQIDGRGLQNEDILTFVDALEQSSLWKNLIGIEMQKESYQRTSLYRFSLRFALRG